MAAAEEKSGMIFERQTAANARRPFCARGCARSVSERFSRIKADERRAVQFALSRRLFHRMLGLNRLNVLIRH